MEKIQSATPAEKGEERSSRPWIRALMGGAVFGGLGATGAYWLGHHSLSPAERLKPAFGRKWTSVIAGVATGTVAMYGTMRAEDKPPRSVFPEMPSGSPNATVLHDSLEHDGVIASPGERSL